MLRVVDMGKGRRWRGFRMLIFGSFLTELTERS